MKSRSLITLAAISLLTPLSGETQPKPDILFIAIDDMNNWTTLFDENHPIQTPNLKRLAERGMFFNHAYASAPVCNPSRAAIVLGKQPFNSGVYGNHDTWSELNPDATILPRYFYENGYTTKAAGKIYHHGAAGRDLKPRPGFEEYTGRIPNTVHKPTLNGFDSKSALGKFIYDWGEVPDREEMGDLKVVDKIKSYYDEASKDKPLFIAAGIYRPHLPFYAPKENFDRYPADQVVMPKFSRDEADLEDLPLAGIAMTMEQKYVYDSVIIQPEDSNGSLRHKVRSYQAASDFADEMVGKLLDTLDATGRADNTIIVLWSDHGYHLGDKGIMVKHTLWEKATHVPLIIVAPGVTKPGSVCSKPVSLVDIYPTLVELAGLPERNDLDGNSLVPLIKNPKQDWQPAITTMYRGNNAVRSERFRYIRYFDGSEELYDHGIPSEKDPDPWDENNLANNPEYASVKESLGAFIPKLEDQVPNPNGKPSKLEKEVAKLKKYPPNPRALEKSGTTRRVNTMYLKQLAESERATKATQN